jgi:hypothetical protein
MKKQGVFILLLLLAGGSEYASIVNKDYLWGINFLDK